MPDLTDLSQGDLFSPPDPIITCTTLDELHGLIRNCTKCDELAEYRTQAVPGVGPATARVVFIGEAPGRWEDEKGEPFVGDAGAYLTELLEKIGLSRSEVFISNILKCRPPDNRNPKTPEMDACAPYLERQLELIRRSRRPPRSRVAGWSAPARLLSYLCFTPRSAYAART
jgi:uracil-DNA glycosylase